MEEINQTGYNFLSGMERAKFLFDLRGFLVVRNVLSAREIEEANTAINGHTFHERKGELRNTKENTELAGDMSTGRFDMAGMLGWKDGNTVFRDMLTHPKLVPYLHMLVGNGYRLDHSPLVLAQNKGSEGFSLHGGSIDRAGNFIPQLQYTCRNNSITNTLLAVSFQLTDHNKGDGGFCVVPGSHKINFSPPEDMMIGRDEEFLRTCVQQPETRAGDVVLFSEATIHGCLPWKADHQRRIALYRFAPSNFAFARGYSNSWPAEYLEGMTPEQLSVMQPPYHPMYDRPTLQDDGTAGTPKTRGQAKIDFDLEVFGTPYY